MYIVLYNLTFRYFSLAHPHIRVQSSRCTCYMRHLKSVKQAHRHVFCVLLPQPLLFHLSVSIFQLRITEDNTCKVRYCAKHLSEVKIDASPVNKEWVECPVGARLELLANPLEVRAQTARVLTTSTGQQCQIVRFILVYCCSSSAIPKP